MRWPWQRERPEQPPAQAPREPLGPATADRVPPAGWAFLPPLQRIVGDVQLTSDPERFAGALSSWNDPSFTGPMAHLVSAQAPPGVIDVDGGGPVPADDSYRKGSGEMTLLLPPPAPAVRPTPVGHGGGPTATAQRLTSDGGTADGGPMDGGSAATGSQEGSTVPGGAADQGSQPAAEHTTVPMEHVGPGPLQRSASLPEADAATPDRSLPASEATPPAQVPPVPEMPAPVPAAEDSSASQPGGADRAGDDGSSNSDGRATYVQIPPVPAVQRTSAVDGAASFGTVQRPAKLGSGVPRLGLGMPLSFSDPPQEPAAAAEPPLGRPAAPFRLPVQRVSMPDSSASTAPPATVAGGDDGASTPDPLPGSESESRSEPEPESGSEPEPGSEPESGYEPEPGSDTGSAVPLAWEAESVPLLAAGGPARTADLAGDWRTGEDGAARPAVGTGPVLPVVSRVSADPQTARGKLDLSADPQDAGTEPPEPVPPALQPAADSVVVPPDDDRPALPVSTPAPSAPPVLIQPVRPFPPEPGSAGAGGAGTGSTGTGGTTSAAAPALQRSPSSPSGESLPSGHSLQLGPLRRGPSEHSAKAAPTAAALPTADTASPVTAPGVQRAPVPEPGKTTEAGPIRTPAGPVVLRLVKGVGGGSAPETWQRLAAMPVVAPPVPRAPVTQPAVAVGPELPAAQDAGSEVSGTFAESDAGAGTGTGTGTGFGTDAGSGAATDLRPAEDSHPEEANAFETGTDESPAASAVVGRVIQRTILMPDKAAADSGARTSPGSQAHLLMVAHSLEPEGPQQRRQPAGLQRSAAFTAAIPGTTPRRLAPEPGFTTPAPAGFPRGPAAASAGLRPGTETPLTLSLAVVPSPDRGQNQTVLQREEAEYPGSDAVPSAPPPAPATMLAGAEELAGMGAVAVGQGQAGSLSGPPGLPEPAARGPAGTAAPGSAAQASPEQLEELAKRLAGPLIRRIKTEMLLDRERRGLRTDAN